MLRHILSAKQFDQAFLSHIFERAYVMENVVKVRWTQIAKDRIMATLFYEPSTRTRLSFESAMLRLWGEIISETSVEFSSITKGERLEDTARIIGGYADIITLRSKTEGDAARMAAYAGVPVMNAGDGAWEHPSQALLDAYTINRHFPLLTENISIAFVGDLRYGRTVHSLSTLLRAYPGVQISYVAPLELQIPDVYFRTWDRKHESIKDILASADVIYDTRIQKERFEDLTTYEALKESFIFTPEVVGKMKPDALLLHPLPRINEITPEVDTLPQAKYFEQAQNGLYVRMALIEWCLDL